MWNELISRLINISVYASVCVAVQLYILYAGVCVAACVT